MIILCMVVHIARNVKLLTTLFQEASGFIKVRKFLNYCDTNSTHFHHAGSAILVYSTHRDCSSTFEPFLCLDVHSAVLSYCQ